MSEKKDRHTGKSYLKRQFLASKKYTGHKDILNALLEDGKTYTYEQVDTVIEKYIKQEAK